MNDFPEPRVFHICSRDAAHAALQSGVYRADSLATDGFIHLSSAHQVPGVLEKFYAGQDGLALLVIDPARLSAQLKYEPPAPVAGHAAPSGATQELFPHLYGPLNAEAIVDVIHPEALSSVD